MPLYIGDYLRDTAHLDAAQHGGYLLLIMHYWQKGSLPKEDAALARIARMTAREWREKRPVLCEFFDSEWRHKRIDDERAEAERKSSAKSSSGARGGAAKALKQKEAVLADATNSLQRTPSETLANGLANAKQTPSETLAHADARAETHNHSHSQKEEVLASQLVAPVPAARSEFDQIEDACRQALGDLAPADPVIGPMVALVRQGIALQTVADVLISEAKRPRLKPIRTWMIWAKIVAERLAESPKIPAKPPDSERMVDLPRIGVVKESNMIAYISDPERPAFKHWINTFFDSREKFREIIQAKAPHLMVHWPEARPQ